MTLWDSQAYVAGARAANVDPTIIAAALKHAHAIRSVSKDLPVVFTLAHLAQVCGVSHRYLIEVASRGSDPYRDYIAKKRQDPQVSAVSRRYRIICMPDPELKKVQRWLHQNILSKISPHPASTAYSDNNTLFAAAGHRGRDRLRPYRICRAGGAQESQYW